MTRFLIRYRENGWYLCDSAHVLAREELDARKFVTFTDALEFVTNSGIDRSEIQIVEAVFQVLVVKEW